MPKSTKNPYARIKFRSITLYTLILLIVVENVASQTSPPSSTPKLNDTSQTTSAPVNITATTTSTTVTTTTPTSATTPNPKLQPRNPENETESSGILCQSDNDLIGQELGCSCDLLTGGMKSANCSNRWIGYNSTLNLPPKLNISRHVRILDLSRNHIHILDENTFGDCESLNELNLYKNHIGYIKSLNCSRITKLDLSWNRLHNLTNEAFMNLNHLMDLDLNHNNLVIVEPNALDRLTNLRVLNLGSNPLGLELNQFSDYILSLDNLKNLETLDLSNTSLPDFPLSLINGTKNIKRLSLGNNMFTFLPGDALHQLTSLEYLDLSGNNFETLAPFGFNGLSSLRTLILDRMPYLKKIEQHAFAGLSSLRELSCQKNHYLSFIDVMAFRMAQELDKELVEGDSHPKIVHLADNNLNYFEYGLLVWKDMEWLELYRNPWICDCRLQWVAEFHLKKADDAAILMDPNFACTEPHIFAGVAVASVAPEEMLCYSSAATIAGLVGIMLFGFLLFTFCSIIILNHMGMLPDWVRRYNIFGSGSSLPKYMRVNPKPARARRMERMEAMPTVHPSPPEKGEPVPGDLEWDPSGDIGPR